MTRLYALTAEQLQILKQDQHVLQHKLAYTEHNIPEDWLANAVPTGMVLAGTLPQLSARETDDGHNAALLHSAMAEVSRLAASDERLWAWFSLQYYPDYISQRWPILRGDNLKSVVQHVRNRWYFGQTPRARQGLARLWWGGELTGHPILLNKNFFAGMPDSEPYHYTRVLFSTKDYQFNLIENRLARAPEIIIPTLHFLHERREAGKPVTGKMFLNGIVRELNLTTPYRRLELLGFEQVLEIIRSMYAAWERLDYDPDDVGVEVENDFELVVMNGSGEHTDS